MDLVGIPNNDNDNKSEYIMDAEERILGVRRSTIRPFGARPNITRGFSESDLTNIQSKKYYMDSDDDEYDEYEQKTVDPMQSELVKSIISKYPHLL